MNELEKDFRKHLAKISGRRSAWRAYQDFVDAAYCAVAKRCEPDQERQDALEDRYMETVGKYERQEVEAFPAMLGIVAKAMAPGPTDFLGTIYEEEGFCDQKYGAQFWTPWGLAQGLARMTLGSGVPPVEEKPIFTLCEPCCGSGRLVLAFADAVMAEGVDPGQRLWVDATDADPVCFQLTYLQMAYAGIPGIVRHGNSISMETWEKAVTPMGCLMLSGKNARRAVQELYAPAHERAIEACLPA